MLTGGQVADCTAGAELLARMPACDILHGDKGYDSNALRRQIEDGGALPNIPPKANRQEPRECDWFAYKERHLIECFFNKIRHYRRIFSRHEKTARNYMGMLRFVSALIWLR